MSLEKTTTLASVEVVFPSRCVNLAWHTYVSEDGEVISGPSVHRKAYPAEDVGEALAEINAYVPGEYMAALAQIHALQQQVAQLQAQLDAAVAAGGGPAEGGAA